MSLRVLALTPYPVEGPSARFRIYNLKPGLERQGIQVDVRPFMDSRTYDVWIRTRKLTPTLVLWLVRGALSRLRDLLSSRTYDAVWIHRQSAPALHRLFDTLLARVHRRLIFDMDDAVYLEYPITHLLANCTHATVGNTYLADWVRRASPNTTPVVVPTVVDTTRYPVRDLTGDRPVVVGWIGTGASFRTNLAPVLPELTRTCLTHGAQLRVIASRDVRDVVERAGATFVEWTLDGELAALGEFDIGIMPLADDLYARGKCAFKLIEYGAVGIPSVASAIGANREVVVDGVTGYLVEDLATFSERLVTLIDDPALRSSMARAARARIEAQYSLSHQVQQVAALMRRVIEV